jgi:predicted RecA/RadA family phage recombinase
MRYVYDGKTIPYTNPGAAIAYDDVIDLDTRIAVAVEAIAVGATGSILTEGVVELPAINTAEFTVGMPLFWNGTHLTNDGEGLTPAGWCVAHKLQAGTTARVKLVG